MAFLSNTRTDTSLFRGRGVSLLDLLSLHRQRRSLAKLDREALTDLGLTREEVESETRRSFWDVPSHWVK